MTPALDLTTPHEHKWKQYQLLNDDTPFDVYYIGWVCPECGERGYEVPDDEG